MTTNSTQSPVTRETSAYVRDRGLRAVMATLQGGVLILRAKGLRSREVVDLGWCYQQAVKQRIAQEKAERRAARGKPRQRGHATLQAIGGALLIAFVLGALGPSLTPPSRTYTSYGYTGEIARMEADAQRRCGQAQDNSGWIQLQDGVIVCTDKRGRRLRQVTTARSAP